MLNLYTSMSKAEKIRLIYSIVVGVFAVALSIAVICVAADIYYSGRGSGVVFARDIVIARLKAVAIPFIVLVGLIACGAVFPLYEVKAKRKPEDAVKLLSAKKPTGGNGEEYTRAINQYNTLRDDRFNLWVGTLVILLICTAAVLCYLLNTANFLGEDITADIFRMVKNILPWIAFAFAVFILATVYNGLIASRQLTALKTVIKTGNGEAQIKYEPKAIATAKRILSSDTTLWVIRSLVFIAAVTFIIVGALNGGARDVLIKAINICTECIGLG